MNIARIFAILSHPPICDFIASICQFISSRSAVRLKFTLTFNQFHFFVSHKLVYMVIIIWSKSISVCLFMWSIKDHKSGLSRGFTQNSNITIRRNDPETMRVFVEINEPDFNGLKNIPNPKNQNIRLRFRISDILVNPLKSTIVNCRYNYAKINCTLTYTYFRRNFR